MRFKVLGLLTCIGLLMIFQGCISDEKMKTGKNIAILVGAQDYSIGIEKVTDSKNGEVSCLVFKLIEIPNSTEINRVEEISSLAAKNLIEQLKPKEYENLDIVKIVINSGGNDYQSSYTIKDVKSVPHYFKIVDSFFHCFKSKNSPRQLIDTTYLPEEDLVKLSKKEEELSEIVKDSFDFKGFKFSQLEANDKPAVAVWVNRRVGDISLKYTFYILRENDKIIYFDRS